MRASLASMLRWLVLPWGRTSGQRIVLNSDSADITVYGTDPDDYLRMTPIPSPQLQFSTSDVNQVDPGSVGITGLGANTFAIEGPDFGAGADLILFEAWNSSAFQNLTTEFHGTYEVTSESGDARLRLTQSTVLIRGDTITITPGPVGISGVLTAGNIASGTVNITPVAGAPTSAAVTGLSVQGSAFAAFTTPNTSVPGNGATGVVETSANGVSSTGLTVWIYRNSATVTGVNWMVIGR